MIVAGGGVIYADATETLATSSTTGIPVGETMAGKGSLRWDHPLNLGAIGATGTLAANRIAKEADLVIGIGTRYSDFTTASKTAFQNPDVTFHQPQRHRVRRRQASRSGRWSAMRARRLTELAELLAGYSVDDGYRAEASACTTPGTPR
jgi:3D-(3,5/4)-trihydroxycyclohexane-1,2-dione acylhydrolase (decyclizing)